MKSTAKITIAIYSCIILISCTKNPIIGMWQKVGESRDGNPSWEFRTSYGCFKEDGTIEGGFSKESRDFTIFYSYNSDKNSITFQEGNELPIEYSIVTLNDSLMIIRYKKFEVSFKRIHCEWCE